MELFENIIWMILNMIPYFSRKLNVLEISKNTVFLQDLLAIVQFLFRRCSPNIEWVTILLNMFSFFYCKNYSLLYIVLICHRYNDCISLHLLQKFQHNRLDSLWMAYRQKLNICLPLAVPISYKSPPFSSEILADVPSMCGLHIVDIGPVVFRWEILEKLKSYPGGKTP